ncbi:MAG: cbb3-type cytochrome c oxidase subunit I [Bacteroidota bacterium]|nr:MAG: cbb3-type cytochrome c oxidase subunit I [Bacteroidota bacterium]
MLVTWLLFVANMLLTLKRYYNSNTLIFSKVYIWMWLTGMFFFLLTFLESYLWLFSFFSNNLVRDITVQWKASGAMVGSWNMLVYGTAFYVMEKMSGDEKVATSKMTFFFYFLGLTNLMFNWGHHTYIVPASPWIRDIAYVISMTELLILGNIIWGWRKTVSSATKTFHLMPYRFFTASDVWIFINLILAIAISVPFINRFTHGTHITVAHAMGTTIGINTFILFASVFYLLRLPEGTTSLKYIKAGFWTLNVSLLIFWVSLIASGVTKTIELSNGGTFASAMQKMLPYFYSFFIAGIGIFAGILLIAIPALISCIQNVRQNRLVSIQSVA